MADTQSPTTVRRSEAADARFTPGQRYVNEHGAWVELRFDQHAGYVPGLGTVGVWYATSYSPDFRIQEPAQLTSHRLRNRVERAMRNWLRGRPFTPEQLAEIDAALAAQTR